MTDKLFAIYCDGDFDQVAETAEQYVKERASLVKLGFTVTVKRMTWEQIDALDA